MSFRRTLKSVVYRHFHTSNSGLRIQGKHLQDNRNNPNVVHGREPSRPVGSQTRQESSSCSRLSYSRRYPLIFVAILFFRVRKDYRTVIGEEKCALH